MKHIFILAVLILLLAAPMKPQTSTASPDQTSSTGFELVTTYGISTTLMEVKAQMGQAYCIGLVHGIFDFDILIWPHSIL
jgi:hypothetical protein